MSVIQIISPQNNSIGIPVETNIATVFPIMIDNDATAILQVQLQVSTDSDFSDIAWSASVNTLWYNVANDSVNLYDGFLQLATNPSLKTQSHIFKAPPGFLKSNTPYYCRFILDVVEIKSSGVGIPVTGHRTTGVIDAISPVFSFTTIANLPTIVQFVADPSELGEFGGKVTLTWTVHNSPDGQSLNIFINPATLVGLGNVSSDGSTTVDIKETTSFTLEARNQNGKTVSNLIVPVKAPTGIIPIFIDKIPFPKTQVQTSGLRVATIGQSFNLQLYTEYMSDIHLFVAYPWAQSNPQSDVLKIDVTPPDLIKNLIDESTQTITIAIPNPNHPESLNAKTAVSGAWGYDAKGKDGNTLRQVSGYFILMGQ